MEGTMHGDDLVGCHLRGRGILAISRPCVEERGIGLDLEQRQVRRRVDHRFQQARHYVLRMREARLVGLHEGCIAPDVGDDQ